MRMIRKPLSALVSVQLLIPAISQAHGIDLEPATDAEPMKVALQGEAQQSPPSSNARQPDGERMAARGRSRSAGALEEVIVTATRRNQNLQEVPFGISALLTSDLERIGATGEREFLAVAPGVSYGSYGGRGRSQIVIRGVGTDGIPGNLQRTTEKFLDELPLTDRWGNWTDPDLSTFDLERVEVLRGPQGTLFGSGALGGAVRLITSKPNLSEMQGKLELGQSFTRGGDDSNNVGAMLNVPLVSEKLGARLVGYYRNDGGYIDNVLWGKSDVNGGEASGGRLLLEYRPADALTLSLAAMHDKQIVDDDAATFSSPAQGRAYEWNGIIPDSSEAKLDIFNLTVGYEFGGAVLTSATTFGKRDSHLQTDYIRAIQGIAQTGTDPDNNIAWIDHDSKRLAQEFRLVSSGSRKLDWTVGAFVMDYELEGRQLWDLGPQHVVVLDDAFDINTTEQAIFGELTYHLSEKWSVTGGARLFRNNFDSKTTSSGGAIIQQSSETEKVTLEAIAPKVSFSYFPEPGTHLYVTASKGFRNGQANFNRGLAPETVPRAFDPDSLWNYEVGVKADLLEGKVKTNLAAYYIDWSDIQLTRSGLSSQGVLVFWTDNAGAAVIKGVEAEITYHIENLFELGTSLSYTDSELVEALPGTGLTVGSTLPQTPKFRAASFVQSEFPIFESLTGYLRLNHTYVGRAYGNINNNVGHPSESYNTLDMRAGVLFKKYELSLYVDNLTDNDAMTSGFGSPFLACVDLEPCAFRLRPRIAGITLRAGF